MKLSNSMREELNKVTILKKKKDQLEAELEEVNDELNKILRSSLPMVLYENGVETGSKISFEGKQIELKAYKDIKIKDEKQFYDFLEREGHSDIIKEEFTINTKEQLYKDNLKHFLEENNIPFEFKKGIHPSTLKAFAKEMDLKSGNGAEITDGLITTIK